MVRRFPPMLAALGACVGVAVWLTLGAFDLAIRGDSAVRIAMLPPLWQLPVLILGLWATLAGLFLLLTRVAARAPGRRAAASIETAADQSIREARALDALRPLAATALLILPFLPWLPDAVPVLRLLGGPARLLVWFIILAQVARLAWQLRQPADADMPGTPGAWDEAGSAELAAGTQAAATRGRTAGAAALRAIGVNAAGTATGRRPWHGTLAIAALTFALCGLAAAAYVRSALFPGGDEPHYLVMAQSLWRDGDLKIENNHKRGDYHDYFDGDLAPHYLTRGVDNEIYSVHPVGMPVLMAPVYALGGYRLVAWTMVAFATGAATLLWVLARRVTGSAAVATVAWAACCVTGPFIFNSFTVYPEVPAALATMVAFVLAMPARTWRLQGVRVRGGDSAANSAADRAGAGVGINSSAGADDLSWRHMLACGIAAATLPWFSTKYAPLSAALMAIAACRLWLPDPVRLTSLVQRLRDDVHTRLVATLALGLPYAISLAGWFAYFYVTWGRLSPSAPYGSQRGAGLRFLPAGGPGLLFDQEYGVMACAPALLLALTGLAAMLRRGGAARRLAIEITLAFGALLGTVGAFHIWWGGSATVGRPLIAGFLLLGLPIAWRYQDRRARAGSTALTHVAIAAGAAVALTFAIAQDGFLLAAGRDGTSTLLLWMSPVWSVWTLAPSFITQTPRLAALVSAVWLLAAAALGWILARGRSSAADHAPGRAALTALASSAIAIAAASLVVPPLLRAVTPDGTAAATPRLVGTQARSAMLDTFDAARRPLAIVFDPFRRVDPAGLPALISFTVRPDERRPRQPIPLLYNARWALPAGRYTVTLIFPRAAEGAPAAALQGTLALRVGRVGQPAQTWDITLNPPAAWGRTFDLPVDANLVGFAASPELTRGAPELRLTPVSIVDAHRRPAPLETLASATFGGTRLFFHDERVWLDPRGFWTPGDASVAFTLTPPPDRRDLRLRLQAGPVATTVRLRSSGGQDERIALAPHATRELSLTAGGPGEPIRLTLDTAPGFVPAALEPGNPDDRRLGCFVEILNP